MNQNDLSASGRVVHSPALAYHTPKLIAYGSLARLTAAGAGSIDEMMMMTNLMMRP